MRSAVYYRRLEIPKKKQEVTSEEIAAQVERFLAGGGKIEDVPRGKSALGPITEHDAYKRMEKIERFGDAD
jgi:hypothetical protein